MTSRRRKLLVGLAAAFFAGLLAVCVAGAVAWSKRGEIVAAVARELGVDRVEITGIGFDREARALTVSLDKVEMRGVTAGHIAVALDVRLLVRERRIGVTEVVVSDVSGGADVLRGLLAPSAGDGQPGAASLADVWSQLTRLAKVRVERARFDLTPIGVPGNVVVERAVFVRRNGFFAAEALVRQDEDGLVKASAEVHQIDGRLEIRAAHAELTNVKAPASYFAFFDTKIAACPILPIERLEADATVVIGAGTLRVAIEHIDLVAPMAVASGAFTIDAGEKTTAYDVAVAIAKADQRVLGFLPVELLGRTVNEWLTQNLRSTIVENGSLALAGDDELRKLDLKLPARATSLTFAPGWPAVEDATAMVTIGPENLLVEGGAARFEGLAVHAFHVEIPAFSAPVVKVRVEARSDAQRTLAALAKTPLKDTIHTITSQPLSIRGPIGATVSVEADISGDDPKVSVSGTANLEGVTVAPTTLAVPPLENLRGPVRFTTARIDSGELKGTFGGKPASVRADVTFNAKRVVAKGDVTASYLATTGMASGRIAGRVRGELRADLGKETEIHYDATGDFDLAGVALDVPVLLKKPVGAARKLRIKAKGGNHGSSFDFVSADLRGTALITYGGDVGFDIGLSLADGVRALRPAELSGVKVDLGNAEGRATWTGTADAMEHLSVDLARLVIPVSERKEAVEKPASGAIDPRDLPAITFQCAELSVAGRDFGEVALEASRIDEGLSLDSLEINMGPASVYRTTGTWIATPFGADAKLAGQIHVRDGGRTLAALGLGEGVRGLRGDLAFTAAYPNPGVDFSLEKLTASLDVSLEAGRIDRVDNMALKALDLVTLHFLELREKGIEIERVKGFVALSGKKVDVSKARIELTSAQIKGNGIFDLDEEGIDASIALRLKISRTINAVALGIVNPLLALGYLSQDSDFTVVKLDGLTEHSYTLKGDWGSPQVKLSSGLFSH